MQWWNNFVDWFLSDDGRQVVLTAVVPAAAIIVAGVIAAFIGRGATTHMVMMFAREQRTSTIAALIGTARKAAVWNQLSQAEQQHADAVALEADVRMRMLPASGAVMAADWAAHEIDEMKRNSVSFSFQAEQSLIEFHNRMLVWQSKPSQAKKLFKNDLDSWAYEQSLTQQERVAQQQAWAAEQAAAERAAASSTTGGHPVITPTVSAGSTASTAPAAAPSEVPASAPTPAPAVTSASAPVSPPQGSASTPPSLGLTPASAAVGFASTASAPVTPSVTPAPLVVSTSASAPSEPLEQASDTDSGESMIVTETGQAPPPVSATTVRQRIVPRPDEHDM